MFFSTVILSLALENVHLNKSDSESHSNSPSGKVGGASRSLATKKWLWVEFVWLGCRGVTPPEHPLLRTEKLEAARSPLLSPTSRGKWNTTSLRPEVAAPATGSKENLKEQHWLHLLIKTVGTSSWLFLVLPWLTRIIVFCSLKLVQEIQVTWVPIFGWRTCSFCVIWSTFQIISDWQDLKTWLFLYFSSLHQKYSSSIHIIWIHIIWKYSYYLVNIYQWYRLI